MRIWILFCCLAGLTACIREEEYVNDPEGNFDQLWKIIDEKYCFLDYKDIDWDAIGTEYRSRLYPEMSNQELFGVLNDMLYELKDGHVNLTSEENQSHFDFWTDSPVNFNESLIENTHYLGRNYRQIAGLKYRILSDNIGYIYYETFADGIGNSDLDVVFSYLADCKALIFDVRNNPGGDLTIVLEILNFLIPGEGREILSIKGRGGQYDETYRTTDRALDYANEVADKLNAQGIRVEVDARSEKIGKKIREATLGKVPYMLVVGDRDMENATVSVRTRGGEDLGAMSQEDFAARVLDDVKTKRIW